MLKKILPVSLVLITFVGCSKSCQKSKGDETSVDATTTAAVVNGKSILLSKLDELHKRGLSNLEKAGQEAQPELEQKIRRSILRKLIDDEIMAQKAQELGLGVDRIEREEALEKYKARMGGPKGYEAFLKHGSMSEEQLIDNLVSEIRYSKLLEKMATKAEISEAEIAAYYEANIKLYNMPETVHARHILLKVTRSEPEAKVEEVKKRALSILEEAKKPGANFEELAKKYSEGPSQKQNGDLGFFGRNRMVKDFEDAAFNSPLKTAVGPVRTDFGFHIVYVEEKKPAHTAEIPEVRDRIIESLSRNKQARQGEDILKQLRKDAKIQILDHSMTDEEFANLNKDEKIADKE